MRPEKGAAGVLLFLDLTKDRDDALGHQIYQVESCQRTHPGVWMVEQHGERCPPGTDRIQGFDDFVHKMHNLGLSIRNVPYFVM